MILSDKIKYFKKTKFFSIKKNHEKAYDQSVTEQKVTQLLSKSSALTSYVQRAVFPQISQKLSLGQLALRFLKIFTSISLNFDIFL
jgi:hypothetical protein